MDGSSSAHNPPMGLEITLTHEDGSTEIRSDVEMSNQRLILENVTIESITQIEATDMFGNQGVWTP